MNIEDTQTEGQEIDVWTTCAANGIMLTKPQIDALTRFHNDLQYWNEKVNLVSRNDIEHLWVRHIIHSLLLLKYIDFKQKARVLDVGTGGGLPGVPLKIARPDLRVVLVDSIKKKLKMAAMFAEHTGLKDITAVSARAEDLGKVPHYRGSFDVIVSRAVAPIVDIVSWTQPLIAKHGTWALLKGGDLTKEVEEACSAFPGLVVEVKLIDAFGLRQFAADEKKVVTCRFS